MKGGHAPVVSVAVILGPSSFPCLHGGDHRAPQQTIRATIAVSVLISAFNALTLSPALSANALCGRGRSESPLARFFAGFNRWFAGRPTDT